MKDKQAKIEYWLESAKRDAQVATDTYSKKHYHYSLFFWQLVIEKTLKAIVIIRADIYPHPIHDLNKLAKQAQIKIEPQQKEYLQEITTFNLEARYDDYKHAFYKKATKEYTDKWIAISQELYQWLLKQI